MITREDALATAKRFLRERGNLPGWDAVERILAPEETEDALAPALRALVPADALWRRCFVVHVRGTAGGVVYVSRETGEVVFAGAVR